MKPSDVHKKLREAEQKALADLEATPENNEEAEQSKEPKPKERINTAKVLNSTYFNGDGMGENYFTQPKAMAVSPFVSD